MTPALSSSPTGRADRLDALCKRLEQAERGELTLPQVQSLAIEAQSLASQASETASRLRNVAYEMRTGQPF